MSYLADPGNWLVVLGTVLIVGLCVIAHYEALAACNLHVRKLTRHKRRRVLVVICVVLITHVAEIWLFGVGYSVLGRHAELGVLVGLTSQALPEYVYFSAMTYTTVGFGDVVPTGAIRFLTGVEALTGFVMITWSASYTFLEMQRDWRPD